MTFWRIVKLKVFDRKPHRVDKLKEFISQAFKHKDGNQKLRIAVCQCPVQVPGILQH